MLNFNDIKKGFEEAVRDRVPYFYLIESNSGQEVWVNDADMSAIRSSGVDILARVEVDNCHQFGVKEAFEMAVEDEWRRNQNGWRQLDFLCIENGEWVIKTEQEV